MAELRLSIIRGAVTTHRPSSSSWKETCVMKSSGDLTGTVDGLLTKGEPLFLARELSFANARLAVDGRDHSPWHNPGRNKRRYRPAFVRDCSFHLSSFPFGFFVHLDCSWLLRWVHFLVYATFPLFSFSSSLLLSFSVFLLLFLFLFRLPSFLFPFLGDWHDG